MSETRATIFPAGRYGRRRDPARLRRLRRLVIAGGTLVVLVVGSLIAYSMAERYGPGRDYDATVERFYDITDRQVVVEFTVVVPAGEQAVCAVRARDSDGAEVGREEVLVEPSPGDNHPRVTHRLATTGRPVTGEVQRCWQADPAG